MTRFYKSVMKNTRLLNFLLETNVLDDIRCLKYKTLEKKTEYVHHYGWNNIHLYAIGIYKLSNNIEITFDYSYEMDIINTKNIKQVIYYNLKLL